MDKDKMRRDFQEWYEADAMPLEGDWFRRNPDDMREYADDTTQAYWSGFKAAYRSSYRLGYQAGYKARKTGSVPRVAIAGEKK